MKRGDSTRVYNVAVVGLSGIEREKGQFGIGKSCLCNRFVRPRADDYFPEHISVLSITDFSGRVVNNDHFLYWGYATKAFEDGPEIGFNVIEQTEFIDDATFQSFKGGKMETYIKRCTAQRVYSAEKLMYICKSQLGIEKEFEQKVLPDGRLTIDGFILVYDVSNVQGRSFERQTEFSATILYNILKAKKPVILVTTKNDEQCEAYIKEAEKMLTRKEFRQINIPIVETSAHENINVDLAFLLLAQLIDKVKNRIRPLSYMEQARIRKEMLDSVSDSFQSLIQSHVTDHRSVWIPVYRELLKYPAFQRYIEYFGEECAQRLFRRHLKRLKDDFLSRRERRYLERLPDILESLFPDSLQSCQANEWDIMINRIKDHPECSLYFIVTPGLQENDWTWNSSESSNEANIRDNRIPINLLQTGEAENVWRNLINSLQAGRKIGEFRQQFKFLLDNTPYVTPGKSLNELQVLFMGHACFEMLSGTEIQTIYEQHQAELYEKARRAYQELMLEHAEVFVSVQSSSPISTVTQQSLRELVEILQEDSRYKALDRLDQERRLMLLQHLGFVHCPIKEHCPSYPNCMDCVVERLLLSTAPKVQQQYNNGNSTNNLSTDAVLSLYLIGATELVDCVKFVLEEILDDDEYELDGIVYSCQLKSGDEIPFNSFPSSTSGHLQARLVLYSTNETLEDTKTYLEKALVNNLEEEDNISFTEPPIVIVFNAPYLEDNLEERECLGNDGQALADSLGCGFVDVSGSDERPSTQLLAEAVQSLVRSLRDRVNPHQSPLNAQVVLRGEPDIRIIMCMFCGDSYGVGSLMAPLFTLPACQQTSSNSLSLLTFLGDRRRSVQIIMSSYHNATSHRNELVHGLILVYSASRVASFAALKSFSNNVPNLPIQILAVTEEGAANTMFTSSLGQKLITEGNSLADELRGHFATWDSQQMVGIYTPFFRQVWDQKTDIEKAFRMESPPMYRPPPDIAPRNNKMSQQQIQDQQNNLTDDDIYEQLPSLSEDESVGSGDALVKPSMIRQRQAQQLPNKPTSSDNFIREFDKFDNNSVFLSGATRRSHRDLESMIGGPRTQQPQGAFLAFATGRRSHNSKPLINNNGNSKPFRQNSGDILQGNNNASSIGKINMSEYQTVTDALAKMNLRFPNTSPPYNNLQTEEYVSDTGHRNRNNRSRRNNHPQPQTDSSSASPVSDPEDFSRPRHKKKSLKGRTHPPKPKAIFTPIPQVPKGFIPVQYQLSGDSGIFSSRNKSLLEEGSPDTSPVDLDKKPFEGTTKDEKPPKAKKEKPKKLSKSKSTEQQQQPQPQQVLNFTTTLEEAVKPKGILERCVRFIEEEGLVMEGLYRVPGNRIHVENLFAKLAEDPDTDLHSLDIPVNAVATALKDFLAKRLPPPFPTDLMNEVERIALIPDRSLRLLELKQFLLHLPPPNLGVLRIIFSHLVRVAENSRINAMDSKNLAICWWPTLLPFSFVDMMRFESMRPSLEDIVQTMIDQYPFLFCGKEDVVMV